MISIEAHTGGGKTFMACAADTMTDDEYDICRVICHDPSCRRHRAHRSGKEL